MIPKRNTIKWHEENLQNLSIHLNNKLIERDRIINECSRLFKDVDKLTDQIERAKKEKKLTFDATRYGVNKK